MLSGLEFEATSTSTIPYADLTTLSDTFFPSGWRRGFWGPQVSGVSEAYLHAVDREFCSYIERVLGEGDFPASTTWVLQYMLPGLNGHLPASGKDTAWPHSNVGHQTLFDPAWSKESSDGAARATNAALFELARSQGASHLGRDQSGRSHACGPTTLCDYPNYIQPDALGHEVWGDNVERLISLKEKYDPDCLIHTGRVFASAGCVRRGVANVFEAHKQVHVASGGGR